ncbi:hypothetical protein D1BOALGB6SA_5876 [Olavius sp. associated proteobacterium Delta 1]|nr:hypothetical protein D1BOALGB6SA_5876 [Olavius sp. associated proteobacterium Delta 1]
MLGPELFPKFSCWEYWFVFLKPQKSKHVNPLRALKAVIAAIMQKD